MENRPAPIWRWMGMASREFSDENYLGSRVEPSKAWSLNQTGVKQAKYLKASTGIISGRSVLWLHCRLVGDEYDIYT